MNAAIITDNRPAWTWADLFSTYRFWGLLLFYALSGTVALSLSLSIPFFHKQMGLLPSDIRLLYSLKTWSFSFGLLLALAAIRSNPVRFLVGVGCLQLLIFAAAGVFSSSITRVGLLAGITLLHIADFTILLTVPAVIAGSLSGRQNFLAAFGAILSGRLLLVECLQLLLPALIVQVGFLYSPAVILLVGLLCLIPVKQVLFSVAPPVRGRSFAPKHRDPLITLLLSLFVPFYLLYWLCRISGEAAHVHRSRELLSPWGVLWVWLVPPLGVFIVITLAEHLNQQLSAHGLPKVGRIWALLLLGCLFYPAAVALLQSGMNRLASHNSQPAVAPAV